MKSIALQSGGREASSCVLCTPTAACSSWFVQPGSKVRHDKSLLASEEVDFGAAFPERERDADYEVKEVVWGGSGGLSRPTVAHPSSLHSLMGVPP